MFCINLCTGKSFVATTDDALTETHKVFAVPLKSSTGSGKGSTSSALVQWTEVQHHPGLVCAHKCKLAAYQTRCVYLYRPVGSKIEMVRPYCSENTF